MRLYKNNTDFVGHSYGCHDNYLMRRDVPWDRIVARHAAVSRHAADFRRRGEDGDRRRRAPAGQPGVYQISQRADFFSVLVSIDTMNRRPLVNTRDEPHADAQPLPPVSRHHRRLEHERMGDRDEDRHDRAGAGSDRDAGKRRSWKSRNRSTRPNRSAAIRTYDWIIELRDGRKISAIDVQRLYLRAAQQACASRDDEHDLDVARMGKCAERSRARL